MENLSVKNQSKIRFVLTGATGFLGRNLLLEIIKNHYKNLSEIEILILGRSTEKDPLMVRIAKILIEDVVDYVNDTSLNSVNFIKEILTVIKCVDIKLDEPNLGISQEDYQILSSQKINFFFHIAALTDFRDGEAVVKNLEVANIQGTEAMIKLAKELKVGEFDYVGSAYACGLTPGEIAPDYVNLDQQFRNPYEKTKLKAEILVRNSGLKCRVFRPSTICGRLIENRVGAIPKFDVFYAWGAFFLRAKQKSLGIQSCLPIQFDFDARFQASYNSGLNIVPADFAAKVMYYACISDDAERDYHLVSDKETPHEFYLLEMLNSMSISGVKMVESEVENPTKIESFYAKTVGKIFAPYINFKEMKFNNESAKKIAQKYGFSCPEINKENFSKLMDYAKEWEFGLKEKDMGLSDYLISIVLDKDVREHNFVLQNGLVKNAPVLHQQENDNFLQPAATI